jgi:hypothetical protein
LNLSLLVQKKCNQRIYTPEPEPAKVTAGSLVGRN